MLDAITVADALKKTEKRRPNDPGHDRCSAPGCEFRATFDKPFCIEHIDSIPYVQALKGRIERRSAEVEGFLRSRPRSKARTSSGFDASGPVARDILFFLWIHGAKTPRRLAIEVEVEPQALESCVEHLDAAGLVENKTLGSRRGTPRRAVVLTEAGKARVETWLSEPNFVPVTATSPVELGNDAARGSPAPIPAGDQVEERVVALRAHVAARARLVLAAARLSDARRAVEEAEETVAKAKAAYDEARVSVSG